MQAVLRGWLYLPYAAVESVGELRKALTFSPKRVRGEPVPEPVLLYRDVPSREIIGVPQAWGRHTFQGIEIIDQTVLGEPFGGYARLPDPHHPSVRNPDEQDRFMLAVDAAARDHKTFLALAPTGTGKTVVALRTAALLGRKTCVVVHLARLRDQWVREAVDKLGLHPSQVGTAEGPRADHEGKSIVIAMLQSLAYEPGRYGRAFYESFGTVIFDEVHRMGAPVFSQAAPQFPARYRMGMTATARRKDDGGRVFFWHLGPIKASSEQEALPLKVYPVWYQARGYRMWGDSHGARMKCLSQDAARNTKICGLITRMYNGGRQALVVAEGINHLQHLMGLCERAGVPRAAMGQFTNQRTLTEKVRTSTGRIQDVAKRKTQTPKVLNKVLKESQIIFATYGMITEGIDIPRLDAGIDATPRSDATQLIGRVRRPFDGKKDPIWVTLVDSSCSRSLRYYQGRLRDYRATGAEVVDVEKK